MNGSAQDAKRLVASIINGITLAPPEMRERCEFLVCPPALHIYAIRHAAQGHDNLLRFGAQDCSAHENGAYTGDISAAMLKDAGCQYVIAGHSERRHGYGESDEAVYRKIEQIHKYEMAAILCIGETEEQRDDGQQDEVVLRQLRASLPAGANAINTVIAYEPVWAIGTGKVASIAEIAHMHNIIRGCLKETLEDGANMRILYGGSVKPDNAAEILRTANVDGALIGGASLKADSFLGIAGSI